MKIAYILFDGITLLDFVGIYDPITRLKSMDFLPDLAWDLCAYTDTVKDSFGLEVKVDQVRQDLSGYDLIIVPGGFGTRPLEKDADFLNWFKTAEKVPTKASICTGSLLLGAAGFLKNVKATSHFDEYDNLASYCTQVIKERIVEDQGIITAGAVSASLDLGLYICTKLAGKTAAEAIRARMNYKS